MIVSGTFADLKGSLWGIASDETVELNDELLRVLRRRLQTALTDRDLVRFLLAIGEAELGGGLWSVESEMEYMEETDVFNK
jgi:hypothetical protein